MFDPSYPPTNAEIESAPLRSQFNGLKALIDAVPGITGAVLDGVTTGNPGDPATVNLSVVGTVLHFSFSIPRGPDGINGTNGINGVNGTNGNDGAQGPPFTNFVVDGVNMLNPGDPADVQASFDGSAVRLSFGIPRGNDGAPGTNGVNGTNGSDGTQGPPFTNFVVDGVTTVDPSDPANVQASFDGSAVRLSFDIPRGNNGIPGINGTNGTNGSAGAQGPAFTNFVVDDVNTVDPGDPASVQAVFDGSAVRLTFDIPRGINGTPGGTGPAGPPVANILVDGVNTLNPGDNATVQSSFDGLNNVHFTFGLPRGNDGGTGVQGPPGEVTSAQLATAISGTSSNSNAVNTLNTPFTNDPPTLADMEVMRAKVNELILALRR